MADSAKNTIVYLSIIVAILTYLYSVYKSGSYDTESFIESIEETVADSWNKLIRKPKNSFKKVVIGMNCCVDLVVSATALLASLRAKPSQGVDHGEIANLQDLSESFSHFFALGAPAERFISNEHLFNRAIGAADQMQPEYIIGGNAANMAQKLATYLTKITLVGSIGPRLKSLLHENILTPGTTKLKEDEIHIVMEYQKGDQWGEAVAPSNGRYITSHDVASNNTAVINEFFKTIELEKPDLVIFSGIHLLEFLPTDWWDKGSSMNYVTPVVMLGDM